MKNRLPEMPEAHSAILLEVEYEGEAPLEPWFELLTEHRALVDHTIVTEDENGRAKLHLLRHALPAEVNEIISRNGVQKVGTDFAVPDEAFPEMLRAYDAVPMRAVCFGHLGNNHLHLNLLPKNQEELVEARQIYLELAKKAVSLGGTVSAEHGIGRLKKTHLSLMVPPDVRAGWLAMRKAADPHGIFGRGVMVEQP
jgi:D-lactate dehydrogenase (cytochrome)